MNINIVTTIENVISSGFRKIKSLRFGSADANNAYQAADFGSDFSVPKDWTAIYAKTGNEAAPVIIGFVNKLAQDLGVGEKVVFSTNENGDSVSSKIKLTNDGFIIINKGDNEGLIKIDDLTKKLNSLVDTVNSNTSKFNLLNANYKSHTHPVPALPNPTGALIDTTQWISTIADGENASDFDKIDYENDKVTH